MSKIVGPWIWRMRDWQAEAYEGLKEIKKTKDLFLCVGTPGSGKTRFAIRVAHGFLFLHEAVRVVVVVPTENLKVQWAKAAFMFGIQLDPNFDTVQGMESHEYHGIVATYAQIATNPAVFANQCKVKKTVFIGDEIHHCGESKTWGEAILYSFKEAVFKLTLSGTPFRRDANQIPFVEYVNDTSKADYTYSYTQAVIDNVCRMVYFPSYNGKMQWQVTEKRKKKDGQDSELYVQNYTHTFDDLLDDGRSGERLRTALDPAGDWMKEILTDADNKLTEIREKEFHTDAGGLITAIDQDHARQIQELMIKITGEEPAIVISDEKKEAARKLTAFRENKARWIVSVKMVSEGTDIPRLRVGVYCTNVLTEMFFRQFVGRFVRVLEHLEAQDAFIFIPKDPTILGYATEIEVERDHALNEIIEDGKGKKESAYTGIDPTAKKERDKKEFIPVAAEVTETTQLEIAFDDRVAKMFNMPGKLVKGIAANAKIFTGPQEIPIFEQKKKLRDEITELAKIYAKNRGNGTIDWDIAHKDWIRQGGKNINVETLQDMKRRKTWLENNL